MQLLSPFAGALVNVAAQVTAGRRAGGSDKFGAIRMDSLITAAARALAAGDPLAALNRVALREDAPEYLLDDALAELDALKEKVQSLDRALRRQK